MWPPCNGQRRSETYDFDCTGLQVVGPRPPPGMTLETRAVGQRLRVLQCHGRAGHDHPRLLVRHAAISPVTVRSVRQVMVVLGTRPSVSWSCWARPSTTSFARRRAKCLLGHGRARRIRPRPSAPAAHRSPPASSHAVTGRRACARRVPVHGHAWCRSRTLATRECSASVSAPTRLVGPATT
jgi:hypothetical protein